MNVRRAATALLLLALIAVMNAQAQTDDAKFGKFKETYRKELADAGIVGSSFVFLKDNKVLFEDHVGSANLEKKQSVNADTIYHWASNTKPFTGIAIMQLRDRGLLKLDDPVTKYVPELCAIHNPFGSMDEITIRHLMTHSGGFRNGTWPWGSGKPWEPFEPTEWSQLVAMFPYTEVLFKPGGKFSYSNPAIIYLSRIIEKLSGDPYEAYIDKNILRPLEMHRTYFDTTPPHLLKYRSHSYYIRDGKRTEGVFDANTGITVSNSGLNSPISDMVKYLNFLVGTGSDRNSQVLGGVAPASGDGAVKGDYDVILKRSSLEEMWQPQLPTAVDANGNRGFTTDIGLIYFIDTRNNRTFIGHGGDQNGFISYIDFEPATRQASILVFNTNMVYPENTPSEKDVVGKLRKAARLLFDR
ncbi:MAG: beta-lactamase family protein [Acidobacteria bacterium]|nr:beta-lactamase family protein [Acidobacteriota bacterium]